MCVVASKNGETFTRFVPDCAMKHSVLWLKTVDEALTQAKLTLDECDFFAAVVGAGSFTGIRIGISAMKGFALAHGKKTLPITSFDAMAYNTLDTQNADEKTLCLVDAMHGAYYACGYQNGKVIFQPAYITETEVLALEKDGYTLCATTRLPLSTITSVRIVNPIDGLIKAVERKAKAGAFAPLDALYVRKSSAEINLCK
jgi:tRNA threonylcarbamoyl adenosine modification protein YeaZ